MAITRNAKKAIRGSARKRVFNVRRKKTLHDTVASYRTLVKQGDVKGAATLLPQVYAVLDKSAKRGIIKKNTASRTKSRLASALKKEGK